MDIPKESIPGEEIMATATTSARSPFPAVHTRQCDAKGAPRRRWLEQSRTREKVALAYAIDARWRNRSEFINGRKEILAFLSRKWAKELDYRLIKDLWAFAEKPDRGTPSLNEWHDDSGHWYRSYGNEKLGVQ